MLLQRALQCFLYKMLHFKIIQGEEQFHRMMENPLDEALKTQMLWNWRHGCSALICWEFQESVRNFLRDPAVAPVLWKSSIFHSASNHQQPLKIWSCCLFDELHGPPLLCSFQLPVLWRINFMFKNIQLSKKGWKKSEMASFDHTNSTVYASFEF